MDSKEIRQIIPEVISIVRKAGEKIIQVKSRALSQVEYKGDGSPVTLADRCAHEIIKRDLLRLTPDLVVLSEEGELDKVKSQIKNSSNEYFWLVDPLDGTKEFLKKLGEYTVNIALIKSSEPVMGVVGAPELGMIWSSSKGNGAFFQKAGNKPERIHASREANPVRILASRSHFSTETETFVDALTLSLGKSQLVQKGSSLKLCVLAQGQAEIYPRMGPTMIWDTAAGYAVASEAGCEIMSLSGKPLTYAPQGDLRQKDFVAYSKKTPGLAQAVHSILGIKSISGFTKC